MYYEGSEEQWNQIEILTGNDNLLNANIYYNSTDNVIYISGDADIDGNVNIKDATCIQKAVAGIITSSHSGYLASDVNKDSSVNIKDATAIQKHIAGIDTSLEIGSIFLIE